LSLLLAAARPTEVWALPFFAEGVRRLHGVGNAGQQNPLRFRGAVDPHAQPARNAAHKHRLRKAIRAGAAQQNGVRAVLAYGHALRLGPERLALLRRRVNTKFDFYSLTGASNEFAGEAHLLGTAGAAAAAAPSVPCAAPCAAAGLEAAMARGIKISDEARTERNSPLINAKIPLPLCIRMSFLRLPLGL